MKVLYLHSIPFFINFNLIVILQKYYSKYDGFVILHGTDTMAYTASALSFMMEHLGKPVILTGSQISICETRTDSRDNLLGALIMAGHYAIPEVSKQISFTVGHGCFESESLRIYTCADRVYDINCN